MSDVTAIQEKLLSMPGVLTSTVSIPLSISTTTYTSSLLGLRDIVEQIQALGYDAVVSASVDQTQMDSLKKTREIREWRQTFWRSLMFAVPVFIVGMLLPMTTKGKAFVDTRLWRGLFLGDLIGLVLTLPVQVWLARRFYINAWKALQHR